MAESKLTMTQWDEVRAKYASGNYSLVDLSLEYGVSKPRVWAHINHGTRSINGGRPSKLTEAQVSELLQKYSTGLYSQVQLGLEYNVSPWVIYNHVRKQKLMKSCA